MKLPSGAKGPANPGPGVVEVAIPEAAAGLHRAQKLRTNAYREYQEFVRGCRPPSRTEAKAARELELDTALADNRKARKAARKAKKRRA